MEDKAETICTVSSKNYCRLVMKEMCLPEALGLDINQVFEVETGKRFEGGVRKLRLEASKLFVWMPST